MNEILINSRNLIEYIRVLFPELEDEYEKAMSEWEGSRSNYIIVGDVLQPYFVKQVEEGQTTDFLTRFAAFVERVCADGDQEALNVLWVRIFEWLIFHPKELKFIWPILGPLTKLNIKDAAGRWSAAARRLGRTENLPENNLPNE